MTELSRNAKALGRNMNFFGNKDIISTIKGKPSTKDEDGFYFDESSGTLYLKIGDNIYEIFSNAKEVGGYIVYNDIQNLTTEEQFQDQNNIGL